MKRIIRRIPTLWILAFLLLGLGFVAHHIFRVVIEHRQNQEQEIYIPEDLEDAFVELKKILKPEEIKIIKDGTEKDMILYHHSLGRWIRNNWGLWRGSRLSVWFNQRGIHHPDNMSGIILTSFWRHLNSKPIELEDQLENYK